MKGDGGGSSGRADREAGRVRPGARLAAWLVTGPPGRGLAFAIDFGTALANRILKG